MDGGDQLDQAKIVLVGDEDDILHCGFTSTLRPDRMRYPSVIHYAYAKILNQMQLNEEHVVDLLSTPGLDVPSRAMTLIQDNLQPGQDLIQLTSYINNLRRTFLLEGMKIRAEQDEAFRSNLMSTKDALLIVCDEKDSELGVGMSDKSFLEFWKAGGYRMQDLSDWVSDENARPNAVGQNQLGIFLMMIRHEIREKERLRLLQNEEVTFEALSTDQAEKPMKVTANSQILSLSGILKPLSNYYKFTFDVKEESYRSVEHYAYERLFDSLKCDEALIQKLRSVPQPADLANVAVKILATVDIDEQEIAHKMAKLDRWRQAAMKHKISKNVELQQLLLNTGNAFLVETNPYGDQVWTANTDEYELQHLLTKSRISISLLVDMMAGRAEKPNALSHLGQNKTGILLMELRQKYSNPNHLFLPLIAPPETNIQRLGPSNNVICFTPESVFHPFYPVAVNLSPTVVLPTAIHYVVMHGCRALKLGAAVEEELVNITDAIDCWYNFNSYIQTEVNIPFEDLKAYFLSHRQKHLKCALALMFQQHSAILRALLETEDALLVYCSRFSTIEAELSCGMRERDFRRVFQESQSDVNELIDFFLRPQAQRPPFLGGNRLGFILMELRRNFTLGGCYPSQYEPLYMNIDIMLGTDSPTENYVCDKEFSVMKKINFTSIWANPYILTYKQDEGYKPPVKTMPSFLRNHPNLNRAIEKTVETDKKAAIVNAVNGTGLGLAYSAANQCVKDFNDILVLEERRAISMKYSLDCVASLNDDQKREKPKEDVPAPPPAASFPAIPNKPGPPPPGRYYDRGPPQPMYQPPVQNDFRGERNFDRNNSYRNDRMDRNRRGFSNSANRSGGSRGFGYRGPAHTHQARRYSPQRDREHYRSDRDRSQPDNHRSEKTAAASAPPASPKPKKPKRVVDESELSEGEIVSSEED